MPVQCAIGSAVMTITRTISVAAGVFAPGHLGELTQEVPFDLVDGVLEDCGAVQERLRLVPSRVAVYFVLALGLFPRLGYLGVWAKLTAALEELGLAVPSAKALREARRRVGVAPLRALFHALAGPAAPPGVPGVTWRGLRTVSFDGCHSLRAADTPRNRRWLGKPSRGGQMAGYPLLSLMALCETGTRALLGACSGPRSRSETTYAGWLVHLLTRDMLVLADRFFDSGPFLAQVAARAHFLIRGKAVRELPVMAWLPDGSFLSRIGEIKVRVILADVQIELADGTRCRDRYRLVTTLADHRRYPAMELIRLYHERWEHEVAYLSLRHTLLQGRVLRSGDPAGVEQELWGLLTLYQAIRRAMAAAAQSLPGTDPDRAGFTIALETAVVTVTGASGVISGDGTGGPAGPGRIGRAVLAALLGPRRPRVSDRKVKCPTSRWAKASSSRPASSTAITSITFTISDTDHRARVGRKPALTTQPGP